MIKPPKHILRTTNGYVVLLTMFDPANGELRFDFKPPFPKTSKDCPDFLEYESWRDKLIEQLYENERNEP